MSSERSLDGKTILVTGGAGFIGSHFGWSSAVTRRRGSSTWTS
jgi:FlaA1/EpsC-like NDP-sugar epimerase